LSHEELLRDLRVAILEDMAVWDDSIDPARKLGRLLNLGRQPREAETNTMIGLLTQICDLLDERLPRS
jgi:hypothetical protein